MRLAEKILFSLSYKPGDNVSQTIQEEWNLDNALSILCEVFPNFVSNIEGKEILDFGCGAGYQAIALARNKAKFVLGIDINQKALRKAQDLAIRFDLDGRVAFVPKLEERFKGRFDMIISQNSMEHFSDPIAILNEMKSVLKENGDIFITFGPPWFSPCGSHTQFFTKVPWVNIFFNERAVMEVRKNFRNDGATRYEDVEGGLNKMSVAKFERIISHCGLKIKYKRYECVKRINCFSKLPLIRELFINRVNCILNKTTL